jgi:hypothetical protein
MSPVSNDAVFDQFSFFNKCVWWSADCDNKLCFHNGKYICSLTDALYCCYIILVTKLRVQTTWCYRKWIIADLYLSVPIIKK